MKIINDALLAYFRHKEKCETCGRRRRMGMEPSHIMARGRGSAWRMDIQENLLSQCRDCHQAFHDGAMPRRRLLEVVAARERWPGGWEALELHLKQMRWK